MDLSWGKMYAKAWTGSLIEAGSDVFAVLAYAIANARPPEGTVELNPSLLHKLIGEPETDMLAAIEFLSAPDPKSRSKDCDGRRLLHLGGYEYRLVNFKQHREGFIGEDLKAYWRQKKSSQRANSKLVKSSSKRPLSSPNVPTNVQDVVPQCPQAEAEAEAEAEVPSTPIPPKGGLSVVIPDALKTDAFTAAWEAWVKFRRGLKKVKDWQGLFQAQLDWLVAFGPEQAVHILEQSRRNGWQGLFELKVSQAPGMNAAQTIVEQKEFDRVVDRMKQLRASYSEHQEWTMEDRELWFTLKERKKTLMKALGVAV